MKLFKNECPQCGGKNLAFHNESYEYLPVEIYEPVDEIKFIVRCRTCNHLFDVDCVPTWIINGEY